MQHLSLLLCTLVFLAACGGGSAQAQLQYEQALRLMQGVGVPQDQAQGLELLQKAADGRNPEAEVMLGFFMLKGQDGVPQDAAKAVEYFIDAAKQGNRDGQYNAGLAYVRAQGVKENYKEALRWFLAAARQDDAGAQYNVGVMLLNGEGTVKDPLTAYAWFTLADEHGYEGAAEGKASAKQAMTSDQVKDVASAIKGVRGQIVQPKIKAIPLPDQPL